nr:SIS domain-containing protein [Pseudomonadota bacterium]
VHHFDPVLMAASTSSVATGDVLLVFSEQGKQASLCYISRQFRAQRGKAISITRHTANPMRAHADASLLVSAHDDRTHIEPLLYQSALQHLLDLVFVLVCESGRRLETLDDTRERIQSMLDS